MRKLVLVGGGGHCKSVIDSLDTNKFDDIVIVDSSFPHLKEVYGIPVVGNEEYLEKLYSQGYHYAFVTVGSIESTLIRQKLHSLLKKYNYKLINVIDKSAILANQVQIGEGNFIGKRAIINADVSVADMCIINTGVIIEHECIIGDFSHISVGSVLCGNVEIGRSVFIGANSTIRNGIKIGNQAIIGMGSCVIKNIDQKKQVVGNPAIFLKEKINNE